MRAIIAAAVTAAVTVTLIVASALPALADTIQMHFHG